MKIGNNIFYKFKNIKIKLLQFTQMSEYLVSARKYRPKEFNEVVGQSHVTTTLENAIKTNQISHAYIFCGPRGVGKTTCARIFANKINNINIENKQDSIFNIFELDAASNNSVDDIRDLVNQTRIPPQKGKYKVYIIDEVHMLSKSAFNAFLKTLEEPPKYCVFILATTEKQKLIPTILSRCQIFEFHRINLQDIQSHLMSIVKKENFIAEEKSIQLIAETADGALRDALSTFDKITSFCGKTWNHEEVEKILNSLNPKKIILFIENILEKNIADSLVNFHELLNSGFEGKDLIVSLIEYFRNIMLCKNPKSFEILTCEGALKEKLENFSTLISTENLLNYLNILTDCQKQYPTTFNQRFLVELCLMQLCSLENSSKKKNLINPPENKLNTEPLNTEPLNTEPLNTESKEVTKTTEANKVEKINESENLEKLESSILGKTITDCLTISDTTKKTAKKEQQKSEITLMSINEEKLNPIWNDLCDKLKSEGKMNLHATLRSQKNNTINNNILKINVKSELQKKEIVDNQHVIIEFLKKKTGFMFIKIEVNLELLHEEKVLYTNEDKLKYMMKKNPSVLELIKNLNLEIKE